MTDAVFGTIAIQGGGGLPVELVRRPDGYWRGTAGGDRVSGVLFGQNLNPWSVATVLYRVCGSIRGHPGRFRRLIHLEPSPSMTTGKSSLVRAAAPRPRSSVFPPDGRIKQRVCSSQDARWAKAFFSQSLLAATAAISARQAHPSGWFQNPEGLLHPLELMAHAIATGRLVDMADFL